MDASTKRYNVTLPLNAASKRYHQTQALMGATRPASELWQRLTDSCVFSCL